MFGDLKLLQTASALSRHASARHDLIAQNIANADTPGYRAQDLEEFAASYARFEKSAGAGASVENTFRPLTVDSLGAESPNGNTVSLEDQMVRAADAQGAHDAATIIYRKTMEILRLSLGRNL